ncbi:hypothetical protein B0I18_105141 [Taibaiella chishuiensis]|uniref:Uncharacterized protein n=1 Tax=Taibaiella chishuiensis TaxID=1434707 RepID=A0A2P8D2V0_9BACT|nr:hypothetical protein B0I18_105141 [Taibaiella chishuiensis]
MIISLMVFFTSNISAIFIKTCGLADCVTLNMPTRAVASRYDYLYKAGLCRRTKAFFIPLGICR